MGGHDEQPESAGRGNDIDGVGLQLSFFPTQAEQIRLIDEAESISPSAFSVSPADIDAELRRGTGTVDGKLRVYAMFQNVTEQKDRVSFLKDEYNHYGHSHTYLDGSAGFVNYSPGKGMELASRSYAGKVTVSYAKMATRLAALIAADDYLTPEQKAQYAELERDYADLSGVPTPHPRVAFPAPPPAPVLEPIAEAAPRAMTQNDIDAAIQAWNGDIKSKHTVVRYMKDHARNRDTATFLQNEYGGDLAAFPVTVDGVTHDVPWSKVQQRIYQLIQADRIYTQEEQDSLDDIDPIAIREHLAEHGIVNGEVVDPAALENSPFIRQVTADVEQLAAEPEPTSPPPIFFVDWEQVRFDLDLSQYADRDIIGYNKDGVQYALGRSGGITYTTETSMITSWGEVLGNEHIPNHIRQQIYDYHQGNLTDEQVRANYMAVLGIELPAPPVENFRITDDALGTGTASEKYAANIAAIRTLKAIEAEGRTATPDEQEILSRYVGWGGLADCFKPEHPKNGELRNRLTDAEYDAARESTLNAHYTSPTVIKAIYEAVENMGFRTGNILEPACGVGNFFGLLPESMAHSKLYGTELDSITGRIAKQLYPGADIQVAGFESTDRRDFYDLAVGNVPFGQYKVADKPYDKLGFSIHDYFFAKTLDQVRPGGVIAFITSRYTMDKKSPQVRRYMAERADLLGAIRLPNNAFKANPSGWVYAPKACLPCRTT
ncbi:hypothetical protein LJC07_00660 [Christensenellaceae bacterium OttesenSCG-928-L17]|nr:hypothetical protein [Christensenellaceae bacterium OttesenSCG-928-L17]